MNYKIKEKTILKYTAFLNELRAIVMKSSIVNMDLLCKQYHTSNSISMHILRLGYFKKINEGENQKLICCIATDFEPHHARSLAKAVNEYNNRPKKKHLELFDQNINTENKPVNNTGYGSIPPSLEEVERYCNERKNDVNPARFIAYYQQRGWVIGKEKMKNWKMAVHTWEHKNYNYNSGKKLSDYSDQELVDELKRRGYTGIMEVKNTITF